jgi:two-component system, cell cycle response regulator
MNLLIAEDDFTTRSALEAMTARLGYTVTCVDDGDKAWQALHQAAVPTLALLDRNMPGLDGLEIIRNVRFQEAAKPCYLVLLTASGEKDVAIEALNAGANDFIRKPCALRELQARLAVGARTLEAEAALSQCNAKLEGALARIAELQARLDNCARCPGPTERDSPD